MGVPGAASVPGCSMRPWAAARPRAVRAASLWLGASSRSPARPSGALHTSGAWCAGVWLGALFRSPARPCGPSGVLHARGPWCAVMASPVSASHAVQSSPCVVSCWRQRYKVRHACEKRAKLGHFERAGRVLYRQWPGAVLVGRVLCPLGTIHVTSYQPFVARYTAARPGQVISADLVGLTVPSAPAAMGVLQH